MPSIHKNTNHFNKDFGILPYRYNCKENWVYYHLLYNCKGGFITVKYGVGNGGRVKNV